MDQNHIIEKGGSLTYLEGFFGPSKAKSLYKLLVSEIEWERRKIRLFGREMLQPRLISFYGDPGVKYRYSGQDWLAKPWTSLLEELRININHFLGTEFNSVLCNYYRNGLDSMGLHSDNERELGRSPTIASLSFGCERKIRFIKKDGSERKELLLKDDSLLVMAGELQENWKHEVPKQKKITQGRVNLTFRKVFL